MELVRHQVILQIGVGQDDKLTKKKIFFYMKGSKGLTVDISQKGWLKMLKRVKDGISIIF